MSGIVYKFKDFSGYVAVTDARPPVDPYITISRGSRIADATVYIPVSDWPAVRDAIDAELEKLRLARITD